MRRGKRDHRGNPSSKKKFDSRTLGTRHSLYLNAFDTDAYGRIDTMSLIVTAKSLAVYRNLLRAVQAAFGGDTQMLSAAREEIRTRMEACRAVADEGEIERLQGEGKEAAAFLTTSIMQLQRRGGDGSSETPTYGLELNANHDGGVVEPIVPGMKLPKE